MEQAMGRPIRAFERGSPSMKRENLVGVILAAGKGTRMAPFSQRFPKPLLPICNRPILEYQIEYMKRAGVREIIIVIGHLGYAIARHFGDGDALGVKIRYVEQEETLGIAHAMGRLEPYITSPFLLFLGDIFFITEDLSVMIDLLLERRASAVLAVKEEKDPEAIKRNFAVILNEEGYVKRVIEKPRYVTNSLKGCGLYLFDLHIFDAIRRTPRTAMRDEYEITDAIQILVDDGFPVVVSNIVHKDMNVSFPHDLLLCTLEELKHQQKQSLVGEACTLHPDVQLEHAVLGNGVRVEAPIQIKESMVFSHTVITTKADLERCIVTPETLIECKYFF
jgi:NDP-sugar pyrophosphorylase family protein